jgi:hypothetical protein
MDEQEPSLEEVAFTAEPLRDLDPGRERLVFEALKPML